MSATAASRCSRTGNGSSPNDSDTYLDLAHSGRFEHAFKRKFFRVLVVADTPGRLTTLSATVARLTPKVFRFATLGDLSHRGPLSSIWRRPGASTFESLTTS